MNNAARWLNKVPEVTLSFWVIKIMSTTVGETGADYLAVDAGFGAGPTSRFAVLGAALLLVLITTAVTGAAMRDARQVLEAPTAAEQRAA